MDRGVTSGACTNCEHVMLRLHTSSKLSCKSEPPTSNGLNVISEFLNRVSNSNAVALSNRHKFDTCHHTGKICNVFDRVLSTSTCLACTSSWF
jgi:hypothetical protein